MHRLSAAPSELSSIFPFFLGGGDAAAAALARPKRGLQLWYFKEDGKTWFLLGEVKADLKEYMQPPLYGHWFCRLPVLSLSIVRLPVRSASTKIFSALL